MAVCYCGHSEAQHPDGGACVAGIWVDENGEGVWRCSCQALNLQDDETEDDDDE